MREEQQEIFIDDVNLGGRRDREQTPMWPAVCGAERERERSEVTPS
jgi:hypothetical protein